MLGLEPDQLVHVDEPGAPATLTQLSELLPGMVPDHFDALIVTGVVEACGPDRYCVPSPSLLQLTIDALAAGIDTDTVLRLLGTFHAAADSVAESVIDMFARIPRRADESAVETLVGRGRGLLAHGLGRLTLHRVGHTVGITDHDTAAQITERLRRRRRPSSGTRRRS